MLLWEWQRPWSSTVLLKSTFARFLQEAVLNGPQETMNKLAVPTVLLAGGRPRLSSSIEVVWRAIVSGKRAKRCRATLLRSPRKKYAPSVCFHSCTGLTIPLACFFFFRRLDPACRTDRRDATHRHYAGHQRTFSAAGLKNPLPATKRYPLLSNKYKQARTMVPNGVHVSSASTPDHEPSVWGPAASVGPVDTDEDNSAHTFLWQIDDAHSRAIFEQRSEHHLCRAPAQPSYRAGAPLALRQLFIERTTTQSEAVASGPQQSPDRSLDGPVTASDTETDSQHEGPPRLVTDGRSPTFGYFLEPQTPVTEQVQEGLDDKSESENVNSLEEH